MSIAFHGRLLIGSMVGIIIAAFVCPLLMRPLSRTKLRLTDDTIEALDGPVIRRDAIASVNEYTTSNCPGFEIVGKGKPRWLRKYSIFVPAALPEYQHVRKVVQSWATAQEWHTD
ncbi:MAG TPA: hypothetical protein VJX30_17100 [Terriglobales bacterium]|nr:hypothetical protein [Terriglobales bacterium]